MLPYLIYLSFYLRYQHSRKLRLGLFLATKEGTKKGGRGSCGNRSDMCFPSPPPPPFYALPLALLRDAGTKMKNTVGLGLVFLQYVGRIDRQTPSRETREIIIETKAVERRRRKNV